MLFNFRGISVVQVIKSLFLSPVLKLNVLGEINSCKRALVQF